MASDTKALPHINAGDSFRWFVGTVVSHLPPPGFEGRVQVRIRGIHSGETHEISQAALPWAQVLIPGTEEGSSGLGRIPKITTGASVWGFFLDGKQSQLPVIVGSFPKTENETPLQTKKKADAKQFNYKVANNSKTFSYVDSVQELFAELTTASREITEVVVDWTETYANKDLSAEDIDIMSGAIGYHYVIRRDGTLQRGLPINEGGSFTRITAHNSKSIGVVFVGGLSVPSGVPNAAQYSDIRSLTRSQMSTFTTFMETFYRVYPGGQAIGHRDINADTNAPGFDVPNYCEDVFGKGTLFDLSSGFITRGPFTTEELNQAELQPARAYKAAVSKNTIIAGVLNFIAGFESAGDYTAVYPNNKQGNLTALTLNQLLEDMDKRYQKYGGNASGRYQFINTATAPTFTEIANRLNYDFDLIKYDPATQDEMATKLLNDRAELQQWIDGQVTTVKFLDNLSRIFASIPSPSTGKSYYTGVGTNKALVTVEDALDQLAAIRGGR